MRLSHSFTRSLTIPLLFAPPISVTVIVFVLSMHARVQKHSQLCHFIVRMNDNSQFIFELAATEYTFRLEFVWCFVFINTMFYRQSYTSAIKLTNRLIFIKPTAVVQHIYNANGIGVRHHFAWKWCLNLWRLTNQHMGLSSDHSFNSHRTPQTLHDNSVLCGPDSSTMHSFVHRRIETIRDTFFCVLSSDSDSSICIYINSASSSLIYSVFSWFCRMWSYAIRYL